MDIASSHKLIRYTHMTYQHALFVYTNTPGNHGKKHYDLISPGVFRNTNQIAPLMETDGNKIYAAGQQAATEIL